MPTIDRFDGIKINVFNGEHRPPHVHAIYGENEVIILIEVFEVYAGKLPQKQLKKVQDWMKINKDWALEVFYELNEQLR